jgi:hypothetical protein
MIDPSTGLLGAKCDRLLAQAARVPRRVAGLDVDQHVALGAQGARTRLRLHLKRPDVAHGVVQSFKVNVSGTRTRSRSSQYPPLWRV